MPADWTQPPTTESPGDLGPILREARLVALENDRATREVRLLFVLPSDAGTPETTFIVSETTHLLTFAYLPPAAPPPSEDVIAAIGDWARQGLIQSVDPFAFGTPLVVARALLHALDGVATLTVEGHGGDADALVWWEVRASGAEVNAWPFKSDQSHIA